MAEDSNTGAPKSNYDFQQRYATDSQFRKDVEARRKQKLDQRTFKQAMSLIRNKRPTGGGHY